jgi:low temperature requirement protein LtrA
MTDLLRAPAAHGHHKVTFVELFFDLVFVFAITQVSHGLIEHFSAGGALQALVLLLAVWWVWVYTSWVTNWLDPERLPVRVLLLVLMGVGLLLSASMPRAFESRGLAFAGAYVAMQVGRTAFTVWALQAHPNMKRNFQRILAWLVFGAVFWIAGGLSDGTTRLALWSLALAIEYVSPSLYFHVPGLGRSTFADWKVEGGHMAERCALFMIIALGESILVTGATFAGLDWSAATIAAFVVSFIGSLAMWWLYFDTGAEAGAETIAHAQDPGRIARLAYTYIHLFLVAGVVVAAVADEFVLAHPLGHSDAKTVITVLGSAALYLLGNLLFKWAITGRLRHAHLVAIGLLAALAPFGAQLAPLLLSALATAVLVGMAAWERRASPHCAEPSLAGH